MVPPPLMSNTGRPVLLVHNQYSNRRERITLPIIFFLIAYHLKVTVHCFSSHLSSIQPHFTSSYPRYPEDNTAGVLGKEIYTTSSILLHSTPFDSHEDVTNPSIKPAEAHEITKVKRRFLPTGLTQHDKIMIRQWSRQTLFLGVPALLAMMSDPLLSLIDTAYVGKLGAIELAALGTCTSIFHFAFNAFRATTTVTTSLVATALATSSFSNVNGIDLSSPAKLESDESTTILSDDPMSDEVRLIIRSSIKYGLINGLLLALGLWKYGKAALHVMGIPSSSTLFQPGHTYLQIRSLAAPVVLFIGVAEGAFRGFSDTTIPLVASLLAAMTNIILDPIMMFSMKMGVGGAAAATIISQYFAAMLYLIFLVKRKMIFASNIPFWNYISSTKIGGSRRRRRPQREQGKISQTIFRANLSMMAKQGSLLFAWAFATACATRLGHEHVAAHQVALSLWLFFVLIIDGAVISAQILMSKAYGALMRETESQVMPEFSTKKDANIASSRRDMKTLTYFMIFVSIVQGLLSMSSILWFGKYAPNMFTTDVNIKTHLMALIPHLAWQQVLISLVLVLEALIVGANQFELLAVGTAFSTVIALKNIRDATDIVSIWSHGIVSLFVGRLITAIIGILKINGFFSRWNRNRPKQIESKR